MDTRRIGFALLVALVLSIGITSIFYLRFVRQQAANRPKVKKVIAAASEIQPGVPVAAESLKEIEWPENVALQGMISNREEIIGKPLTYPVGIGEPILQKDLAPIGSMGLAAKIPDGMRAVAVRTNDLSNMAGFVFPGSHVDVLVTLRNAMNSQQPFTRTVLQNVQVLSAGTKIEPDPQGKPESVSVVTLLVNPEDSQLLTLAQDQGAIQFTLRNSGDGKQVQSPATDTAVLAGAPPKPPEIAKVIRPVIPKPKPPMYEVETISGNKSVVSKFALVH